MTTPSGPVSSGPFPPRRPSMLDSDTPTPTAPQQIVLDFDPARDGFSFPNRFAWTEDDLTTLSTALRPLLAATVASTGLAAAVGGRVRVGVAGALTGGALGWAGAGDRLVGAVARRWPSFGLCGGMALASIERWPCRGRIATSALKPEPIRALLRRRQETTLRASLARFARYWVLVRFAWGATADAPLADALAAELDRVEAALASGRPALLGLVGDAPDPFALHQVVAFGIERTGRLASTILIYDPNAPGQTRRITTAPSAEPGRTSLSTDIPTGPRASGGAHISTRPGHLSHVFVIDVP